MGNGSQYTLHHNCESFGNEVLKSGLTQKINNCWKLHELHAQNHVIVIAQVPGFYGSKQTS